MYDFAFAALTDGTFFNLLYPCRDGVGITSAGRFEVRSSASITASGSLLGGHFNGHQLPGRNPPQFCSLVRHDDYRLRAIRENAKVLHGRTASKIPAAPMPPPTHIVTIPYWTFLRGISWSREAVNFAPVHPIGCPQRNRATVHIHLCGVDLQKFDHRQRLCRERLASTRSAQSDPASSPANFNAFGTANTGPIPISSGSQPAVANAISRPIAVTP